MVSNNVNHHMFKTANLKDNHSLFWYRPKQWNLKRNYQWFEIWKWRYLIVLDNKNQDKYGVFELNLLLNTIKNSIKLSKFIKHQQHKEIYSILTNEYVGLESRMWLNSLRITQRSDGLRQNLATRHPIVRCLIFIRQRSRLCRSKTLWF